MNKHIPPFFYRLFQWFCKPDLFEELQGDLEEAFIENVKTLGLPKARNIYRKEVWKMIRPSVFRNVSWAGSSNRVVLLRNFYLTAIRNLYRHKNYFLINFSGLTIGMTCFTFIAIYVVNELSYDRFHSKSEKIYKIGNHSIIRGEPNFAATTSSPMARTLLRDYPEVQKATRVFKKGPLLISVDDKKIIEESVLFADSTFFNVFDFNLIHGDADEVLSQPRSIILSESYARKYFGDQSPINRKMTLDDDSIFFTITGVVQDLPANSHIQFDMLGSSITYDLWNGEKWISGGVSAHTYVVVDELADVKLLAEKMKNIVYKYYAPEIEYFTQLSMKEWEGAGNTINFKFTPLKDIHLHSVSYGELEPSGNIRHVYIYGLIGLIILAIAIFNFINLATAHSSTRSREVGVRKVIGSTKTNLVAQFIIESIVISTSASIVAIFLVALFGPPFNELLGIEIISGILTNMTFWILALCLGIIVGFLAGCYPAFVLSSFKVVDVLKGISRSGLRSSWLRNTLVTLQFTASIVILIGTLVIYSQMNYMLTKNLGFEKEQVLFIKRPDALKNNAQAFKNDLKNMSNVVSVAHSQTVPGKDYEIRSYRRKDDSETFLFLNNQVTYEYLEMMGMELIEGRFFSKEYGLDSNAVVLNESAVKAFGFEDPVGQHLTSAFKSGRVLTVIGVVKDYHIESLHKSITPMSLELESNLSKGYMGVRLTHSNTVDETLEFMGNKWSEATNDEPFQYFFFDDEYAKLYRSEASTGKILVIFSGISIFIACLGLIGLITYMTNRRQKEIGIRKVLGAGSRTLVRLLGSEIAKLVFMAVLVSWPLAYFGTSYWLDNFENRISVGPLVYIASTSLVVFIILATIGYQTMKAVANNPVKSLRQE